MSCLTKGKITVIKFVGGVVNLQAIIAVSVSVLDSVATSLMVGMFRPPLDELDTTHWISKS